MFLPLGNKNRSMRLYPRRINLDLLKKRKQTANEIITRFNRNLRR